MTFYCKHASNALFLRVPSTDPKSIRLQPVKILILNDGQVQMTGNGTVRLVSDQEFEREWTMWKVEGEN